MRPYKDKYEAIIDIVDEFFVDFKDQGYLDKSSQEEYGMIIQIYDSYKKKIEQEKEISEEELKAMTTLINKVDEIKPEVERILAMKCFW